MSENKPKLSHWINHKEAGMKVLPIPSEQSNEGLLEKSEDSDE